LEGVERKADAEWKSGNGVLIAMYTNHTNSGDIVSSRVERAGLTSQLEVKIPAAEINLDFQ
jgi:hypothetical protein